MDILFVKGSTFKQKVATVIVIIFFVLFMWGAFSHILVKEAIFKNDWSNYIAGIVTLLFLILLLKPNSPFRENLAKQKKSIEMTAIAFLFFFPFFTKLVCERGIPIMLHTLTSESSQIEVLVKEQVSNRGCRKGVKLIGYEHFGNGKVCGLHDKFLSFAKYGTKFTLIGEESAFGFTTDSYRYEEPTEVLKNKNVSKVDNVFDSLIYTSDMKIIDNTLDKVHIENNNKVSIQNKATIRDVSLVGSSSLLAKGDSKINSAYLFDNSYLFTLDKTKFTSIHLFDKAEAKFEGGQIGLLYLYGENIITIRKLKVSAGAFSSPQLNFSGGAIFFTKSSKINIYARDVVYKNKKIIGKWQDGSAFSFTLVYVEDNTYTKTVNPDPNIILRAIKRFTNYLQNPMYIPNTLPSQVIIKEPW